MLEKFGYNGSAEVCYASGGSSIMQPLSLLLPTDICLRRLMYITNAHAVNLHLWQYYWVLKRNFLRSLLFEANMKYVRLCSCGVRLFHHTGLGYVETPVSERHCNRVDGTTSWPYVEDRIWARPGRDAADVQCLDKYPGRDTVQAFECLYTQFIGKPRPACQANWSYPCIRSVTLEWSGLVVERALAEAFMIDCRRFNLSTGRPGKTPLQYMLEKFE